MDNTLELEDKVCLITGASRGLGRALALEFARRGASLVLNSRSGSGQDLAEVERQVLKAGTFPGSRMCCVLSVQADVSQRADVERLAAEALARFGSVDVLVNNASALGPTPMPYLADTPIEQFETVLRTNLNGPFMLTRALVGQMLGRGTGSIINVSSDAGVGAYSNWGAYGVSKAAVDHLTRIWAAELEGTGVRMNSVDPGDMDTVMKRASEPDGDPAQWARPETVTPVFVYLASDRSGGVNGQRFSAQDFIAENRYR
ncbi:MAG: SDR family NAD(P)-dependent oxidoreductase [Anaerolineaceae bacterium]|nr:SDR family NAD(P)-dependent oxidoreductase [Anaerolineaceae bacterium]